MDKETIERITKRHIGRILQRLEEIDIPLMVKDSVKSEFWLMSDDLKAEIDEGAKVSKLINIAGV